MNQDQFVWNPYLEFIKEQNDVNTQLLAAVDQLGELCGKILKAVSKQQHVHRYRYNYVQDGIWEVHEELRALSARQDSIREELGKQGETVFRLHKSFQNHSMSLREFTDRQSDDLDDVRDMHEKLIDKLQEHEMQRRQAKKSIGMLLSTVAPINPMKGIVVDGITIDVNHLLNVDEEKGIAYFSSSSGIITVAIDKLDAIHW